MFSEQNLEHSEEKNLVVGLPMICYTFWDTSGSDICLHVCLQYVRNAYIITTQLLFACSKVDCITCLTEWNKAITCALTFSVSFSGLGFYPSKFNLFRGQDASFALKSRTRITKWITMAKWKQIYVEDIELWPYKERCFRLNLTSNQQSASFLFLYHILNISRFSFILTYCKL